MPEALAIVPLRQRPEYLAQVARWHHAECQRQGLVSALTLRRERLAQQLRAGRLPVTLIALRAGSSPEVPSGCVSLVRYHYRPHDAPVHSGSPVWLSSLYVPPECRAQGLGGRLVAEAEAYAHACGERQLWLSTHDHADFYRRRGWRQVRSTLLVGREAQIMTKELVTVDASPGGFR